MMLTTFCVEIDGTRRAELEEPGQGFASCKAYHDWLKSHGYHNHGVIVNKAGSACFQKRYGDATPGSGQVVRVG